MPMKCAACSTRYQPQAATDHLGVPSVIAQMQTLFVSFLLPKKLWPAGIT